MVLVREIRTDDLPAAERFAAWHAMTAEALLPGVLCTPRRDLGDDLRASARVLELGAVRVSALSYPPLETRRTPRPTGRSEPESCQLMLNVRGGRRIVQGGRDTTIGPGELTFFDAARPWRGWAGGDAPLVEGVMVRFPRALLPLPARSMDRLIAARLSGREGVGALLAGFLRQLTDGAARFRPADGARLAGLTVDLVAAVCAEALDDAPGTVAPDSHRRVLLTRIHDYIERHLGDPGLGPAGIAAAHQISVRHLHALFHEQGMTVAGRIRQRRLERCHHDLADPRLLSRPVHAVAARWGFTDAPHFSRVFRAAYGMSPSDHRALACRHRDAHGSASAGR
ncbi:AraC-like ligand-binding domain-containing protein [Allostreptomyces psammosilenae]|uniref:AraC-like DNA-binding protein n=1 Tax=Allostreptomyces psammosilenae TaxID=1892865 RepID=A0A852ZQ38_9ACTN|nr:helix-turn-helix domain-containing protein [Allostreptomyces psammosilenae]NYI04513.1 AraC-like DNA-binding protein [Allostreptomyces psammosilenae]